jgi:predicted RNase H-like HicB family nuclease
VTDRRSSRLGAVLARPALGNGDVRERLGSAPRDPRYHPLVREHRHYNVSIDREEDGRWIADIEAIPGAMAYGDTKMEAVRKAAAIAFRALAERIENGDRSAVRLAKDLFPANA